MDDFYRTLEITTVSGCKVQCSYCPQDAFAKAHKTVSPLPKMTLETFSKSISTVPGNVDICFSGYAEPWLNRHCTDMVLAALNSGHSVKIFSTLVGMTLEDAKQLISLPLKRFVVHLPDNGTFMKVKVDNSYLEVLQTIAAAQMPNLSFMAMGEVNKDVLKIVPKEKVSYHALISRAGNVNEGIIIAPAPLSGPIRCSAERLYRNVLLPNGDVSLCCMDFGRNHVIGNLLSGTFFDLHSSVEFANVLSLLEGGSGNLICRRCEFAVPA